MQFDWAFDVIYVYLMSNVVFPSVKIMFVYKKIWTRSDLETCLCDDVIKHNYQWKRELVIHRSNVL